MPELYQTIAESPINKRLVKYTLDKDSLLLVFDDGSKLDIVSKFPNNELIGEYEYPCLDFTKVYLKRGTVENV